MDPQSAAPTDAPKKKRNLVPILVAVGVVVVALIAVGVWMLTSDSGGDDKGIPAGQSAKALFTAWEDGDRAAAAEVATPDAVTQIFAIQTSEVSGLEFGGCSPVSGPFPKECIWSRPGGELTMTVEKGDEKPTVTEVELGAAGLPPDTTG